MCCSHMCPLYAHTKESGPGRKGEKQGIEREEDGGRGGDGGNASLARYVQAQGKIMYTYNVKIIGS